MSGQCHTNTSRANMYHGLINQGSTCYLNSVLQVLCMTKDFREAVQRNSGDTFLDCHLKALFDDLQDNTAKTSKITENLGIDNVYEQQDAAEYFESVLRMTSPDASKIFHGQLVNSTVCSVGHLKTGKEEPFWHLPLSLVDSCREVYSVVKGIKEFFKTSDFCGENQMYCEQCDDKVDATMRDVIQHHPDVLCLLLKRFEFNYHCMSYMKINGSVEVPYTLQIPESQEYELYATVDHFGDLRGGHYTATIKIQEEHGDRWYKFDDNSVTESCHQDNTKSQTAYLLFYRKKNDAGIQDVCTSGDLTLTTNNENDRSQDGNNQRKRKNKDIPEAACSNEAKRLLDASFKVAPLDKKANMDNGTTGGDDLEQKCIEVHDDKKKRSDNNTDFKCEHETKGTISAEKPTAEMCSDTFRNKEGVGDGKERKQKKPHIFLFLFFNILFFILLGVLVVFIVLICS